MQDANVDRERKINLELRTLVDQICDRFEHACRADEHPRLESYLEGCPEPAEILLFRELLLSELESRQRNTDWPVADDYRARFPKYASVVNEIFAEKFDEDERFATRCLQLVEMVQTNLDGKSPLANRQKVDLKMAFATAYRTRDAGRASLPAEYRLWLLLVGCAIGGFQSAPSAAKADTVELSSQLENILNDLLEHFSNKRCDIVLAVLRGFSVNDTAQQNRVSNRTVRWTCRTAEDLLQAVNDG